MPFSHMCILRNNIGDPKTILDLGCGDGSLMELLAQGKNWQVTGIEIYPPSLKEAQRKKIYKELIKGDILEQVRKLYRRHKKYQVILFSEVIEHLPWNKGEKVLRIIEKIAEKKIIIGTPRGFMNQPNDLKGNPHQIHKSGRTEEDFRLRNYKVYGVGLKPIWSENGLARTSNRAILIIMTIVGYLFSPAVYFFPRLGVGIIAIKNLDTKSK